MNKISIVTPSFNSGEFIERTIMSVKTQCYDSYEHIIVDAGSTDGTEAIVKKYPNIVFIIKEKCPQSEALNIGFKKATGEIIGWINSDDVYVYGAFKAVAKYLEEQPDVDMVYSDCMFIDENDNELMLWKTADFSHFRNLNYAQMIPQQTIFFRKSVFSKIGYLDESLNYAMDYDFLIRVSKCCKIKYLKKVVLARFRLHSSSKTMAQRKKFEPEVIRIRSKYGAVIPYQIVKIIQCVIGLMKKRL
jgi:glycosyltransferase involved in cell wall biosynthesis